jgi:hypothetical protein
MIPVVGPYLWMQEHSDRANHPMLPVVSGDDRDALDLLLVASYEPGMGLKGRNILSAVKPGTINQQSDFAVPTDERINLGPKLAKVFGLQLLRRDEPQCIGGDDICLDHSRPPSWSLMPSATLCLTKNRARVQAACSTRLCPGTALWK